MANAEESPETDNSNSDNVSSEPERNASSETSTDLYDTPSFDESDDAGWKTNGIDPGVLQMLEENIGNMEGMDTSAGDITELENSLWAQSPTIPAGENKSM